MISLVQPSKSLRLGVPHRDMKDVTSYRFHIRMTS